MADNKYVLILAESLRRACKQIAKDRGTTYTKMMIQADLNSSELAVALDRYRSMTTCEEHYHEYGLIDPGRFTKICNIFDLDPDMFLCEKMESESQNNKPNEATSDMYTDIVEALRAIADQLTQINSKL